MEGTAYYNSPVGLLLIKSVDDDITLLHFVNEATQEEKPTPVITQCKEELDAYFAGKRKYFDIPVSYNGSEFQNKVWSELQNIPYGKTISYTEQAVKIGDLKSIRAVALANGQNPIAIIIPCHRVIGKDGSLVGYGGGLDRKTWLLRHEGALAEQLEIF